MANFFGFFGNHQSPSPAAPTGARYRPGLESLEDRCVMSAVSILKGPVELPKQAVVRILETQASHAPGLQDVLKSLVSAKQSAKSVLDIGDILKAVKIAGNGGLKITGININPADLEIVDGVLQLKDGATATITGTLAGLPFTTTITEFALDLVPDAAAGDDVCTVLDLAIAPIDIDLLGLHVDTTPICLTITAFEDQGILGDLLCGLAGGDLGILGSSGLTNALSDILGRALAQAKPAGAAAADICDGDCEVLHLAVGPVDLNLLGVNVHLDNCADGPVEVCVSASEGQGILGNLLCGLADGGILNNLGNLDNLLHDVLGGLGLKEKQIDKVVDQVTRLLADGSLSLNDIARLTKTITHLLQHA